MLISDFDHNSSIRVIEEASSKNNYRPKVRGLFQRADEANQNKRVYPRPILENQVKKLQPLIKERRLCGELDHPQNDTVKLTNASHLVTKLWMEGSEVFGEAEILNTPNGKVAQALINDGVKIGISSRGLGTLSENQMTGHKTVNEDFNLVTFDLVADPSTRGCYPTLSESKILEEAKYERTLKEAVKERVFITMLKNKLYEAENPVSDANEIEQNKINKEALKKKTTEKPETKTTKKPVLPGSISDRNIQPGPEDYPKDHNCSENSSVEYLYTRSMERLAENDIKRYARQLMENAKRGYPGVPGGTKKAVRMARRLKKK